MSIGKRGFVFGICYLLFMSYFLISHLYAAESVITDSEGYACMGDDKSRKQTEEAAMAEAKRKAVGNVTTYIKSETRVKDFQLEKDIVEAYARANRPTIAFTWRFMLSSQGWKLGSNASIHAATPPGAPFLSEDIIYIGWRRFSSPDPAPAYSGRRHHSYPCIGSTPV